LCIFEKALLIMPLIWQPENISQCILLDNISFAQGQGKNACISRWRRDPLDHA
jgi:hypothetical protein